MPLSHIIIEQVEQHIPKSVFVHSLAVCTTQVYKAISHKVKHKQKCVAKMNNLKLTAVTNLNDLAWRQLCKLSSFDTSVNLHV